MRSKSFNRKKINQDSSLNKKQKLIVGWREWTEIPDLGIASVKSKIDTGARTSSLHAFDVEVFRDHGKRKVRFKVHPFQRDSHTTVSAVCDLYDLRVVKDSGGKETLRPVILTEIVICGVVIETELTLASRDSMGFRMLIGRKTLHDLKALVDPRKSFLGGKLNR